MFLPHKKIPKFKYLTKMFDLYCATFKIVKTMDFTMTLQISRLVFGKNKFQEISYKLIKNIVDC